MKENREAIIASTLSSGEISTIRARLEQHGMIISDSEISKTLSMTISEKERALSQLEQLGLRGVRSEALNFLVLASLRLEQRARGAGIALAALDQDPACDQFVEVIDAVAIDALLNFSACLVGCLVCCGIADALFDFVIFLEFVYVVECIG